jgi:hypothetical protein
MKLINNKLAPLHVIDVGNVGLQNEKKRVIKMVSTTVAT